MKKRFKKLYLINTKQIFINSYKNFIKGKAKLNSPLVNVMLILFGSILLAVILLYLIAPFYPVLLKPLLFFKVLFFFVIVLIKFLVKI